jgi:hypothetical protein
MTLLEWAQFAALVLAALFFLVKAWQGWFNVNMSLSGVTRRRLRGDGLDDLIVEMTVTRGQTGSISIHETAVRVSWPDASPLRTSPLCAELTGITRLKIEDTGSTGRRAYRIKWPWEPARSLYKMPPTESSIWSCCVQVPADQVCTVEVAVVGLRMLSRAPGQWKASFVSLPASKAGRHAPPEG